MAARAGPPPPCRFDRIRFSLLARLCLAAFWTVSLSASWFPLAAPLPGTEAGAVRGADLAPEVERTEERDSTSASARRWISPKAVERPDACHRVASAGGQPGPWPECGPDRGGRPPLRIWGPSE